MNAGLTIPGLSRPSPAVPAPIAGRAADESAFSDLLARARSGAEPDEIRGAAEQLVSTAFIAPILKQIRETSQAAPPFQPTPAEKQFGSMLDAKTAHAIVESADLPIVDRLTETFRQLSARAASRSGIERAAP